MDCCGRGRIAPPIAKFLSEEETAKILERTKAEKVIYLFVKLIR